MLQAESRLTLNNKLISDNEAITLLKNSDIENAEIEFLRGNNKLQFKVIFHNGLKGVFRAAKGHIKAARFLNAPLNFIAVYKIGKYFYPKHNIYPPAIIYRVSKKRINKIIDKQDGKIVKKLRDFLAYQDPRPYYCGSLSLWIENSVNACQHVFWKMKGSEKPRYPLNYEHLENPFELGWTKEFIKRMVYFGVEMLLVRHGDFHAANWVIMKESNVPFQVDNQTILFFYDTQKEMAKKHSFLKTNIKWGKAEKPRICIFPDSLLKKLGLALKKDWINISKMLTNLDNGGFGLNKKDLNCLFNQWTKIRAKLNKFNKNKISPKAFFSLLSGKKISFWYQDDDTTPIYFIEGW